MQKPKKLIAAQHPHEDLFDNQKHFQLERLILFSDAVFAIVITLLVIEIKVPEIAKTGVLNEHQLEEMLGELFPHFLGFLMSFFVIGIFWQTHHRMFGFLANYDGGLLWRNLFLLMFVCILPFTTSLVSEHGYLNLAYIIYSLNLACIGFMTLLTWLHISNPKNQLSHSITPRMRTYAMLRSITVCVIFCLGAILCIPDSETLSTIARFIFALIFPAMILIRKLYKV